MSKNPYCKICNKYHWDVVSFYDADLGEHIMFCSEKHKREYIQKKNNPNYRTSQDLKTEKILREQDEENAERRERRRQAMAEHGYDIDGNSLAESSQISAEEREARAREQAKREREEKERARKKAEALDMLDKVAQQAESFKRAKREFEEEERRKRAEKIRAMGVPTPEVSKLRGETVKIAINTGFEKYAYKIKLVTKQLGTGNQTTELIITPLPNGYHLDWKKDLREYNKIDNSNSGEKPGSILIGKDAQNLIFEYIPEANDYTITVAVRAFLSNDKERYSFESEDVYFEGPDYAASIARALERQKNNAIETIEKNQKDSIFLKQYGTILVFCLSVIVGFIMLKNGGDGKSGVKIAFIALFFTIYQAFILALPYLEKDEIKNLIKKYNYKAPKNPLWLRVINIFLIVAFYLLTAVAFWHFNQKAEESMLDTEIELNQYEETSIDPVESSGGQAPSERSEDVNDDLSKEIMNIQKRQEAYLDSVANSFDSLLEEQSFEPMLMEPYTIVDFYDGYTVVVSEATIQSEVIREINHGEEVIVLEKQDPWWKVELDDASIGYVHKSRLIESGLNPTPPWVEQGIEKEDYMLLKEQGYLERPYLGD